MIRYGAAELYGFDLVSLPPQRLRELSSAKHKAVACPFKKPEAGKPQPTCSKKGGVCSLRQFSQDMDGNVTPPGLPVTTCPQCFLEGNLIFEWVGETLLDTKTPAIISELPFLMGEGVTAGKEGDAVGKIDKVLVNSVGDMLKWCALEMQAVYFSGQSMENDFALMRNWQGPDIPFPRVQRRPDFRSSGSKRLMPQLQIKVPRDDQWNN